jgi:hypothetical protein
MKNISSTAELKEGIQIMEAEQAEHLLQLREEFYFTMESMRPANLIGSTLKEIVLSPNLVNNILGVTIGLLTGYLSRKAIFVGVSNSKYGRIFGNFLQFGVANLIARSPKAIKSVGQFISQHIFRKKEKNYVKP